MNKIAKILLVATSLSPILITYWFVRQVSNFNESLSLLENIKCNYSVGSVYLISSLILLITCIIILRLSKKKLELQTVKIEEIKTADKESLAFIIVYLLPLAQGTNDSFSLPVLIFVGCLFFFIVLNSNSYHFNPILSFFGYHFYEVKIEGGMNYILISKKNIRRSRTIQHIYQLTEYMILEK